MRFTSQASSDGVTEQLFTLPFTFGEIPGVLWTPDGAAGTRPLILMGHGGGQHKKAPGIVARARRFAAECGFAVAAVDVPGHGDRPGNAEHDRIIAEMRTRMQAGREVTALLAGFHALLAGQTRSGTMSSCRGRRAWSCSMSSPQLTRRCTPTPASTRRSRCSSWTARCGSSPGTCADTPCRPRQRAAIHASVPGRVAARPGETAFCPFALTILRLEHGRC
jgi:hypothetical protein